MSIPADAVLPPARRAALAAVAAAAALLVAACGSGASRTRTTSSSAAAPACLPAAVNTSARLAGTSVEVSPGPGTGTGDPHTQISFLGAKPGSIRVLSVVGSRSGRHGGSVRPYSQGDGASFVPSSAFTPGETVTVRAAIAGRSVSFRFGIDTPFSVAGVRPFPNPAAEPGDYQTFATLPDIQAPVMTVTTADRDPGAGDIFTSNGPGPGSYGALIYNPQGQLVWDDQLAGGRVADDVNVQSYHGHNDLTMWQGNVISLGFGLGEDLVLDSHYRVVATVRAGNGLAADLHEFQLAPHDVAYMTAYNPIRCNLSSQPGGARDGELLDDTVEEIDMRTGLVRWEWHALDHVTVGHSETSAPPGPWDWFHLNSIDPEPNGDVFLSARNTWAGYQIQAGTGQIAWTLGGLNSSFKMGPGAQTYWQHDGRILPNGDVTFFDDGADPAQEAQSRAVTIAVDLAHHTARLLSARTHDPPLLAASQGNVQTLSNGNAVVGFGGIPYVTEYAPNGSVLFDAHLPVDYIFYRAYRHPWSAQPLTRPAVAANLNNVGQYVGEAVVHMSWNGATDVASWRVLAGFSQGKLVPRATVRSSGFETSTLVTQPYPTNRNGHPYRYAAVQALDSAGRVLATSPTVPIRSYAAANPVAAGGR